MRVFPIAVLALLLAGCADPEPAAPTPPSPTPTPTASPSPAATTSVTPSATPIATPPAPTLGVVLDEVHDYTQPNKVSTFDVTGGESRIVIFIDSAGPPADGSFQSAAAHFYFPRTTSPFLAELPGQEAHNFTIQQQPHEGEWRIEYSGTGKTSVHIRVTLE